MRQVRAPLDDVDRRGRRRERPAADGACSCDRPLAQDPHEVGPPRIAITAPAGTSDGAITIAADRVARRQQNAAAEEGARHRARDDRRRCASERGEARRGRQSRSVRSAPPSPRSTPNPRAYPLSVSRVTRAPRVAAHAGSTAIRFHDLACRMTMPAAIATTDGEAAERRVVDRVEAADQPSRDRERLVGAHDAVDHDDERRADAVGRETRSSSRLNDDSLRCWSAAPTTSASTIADPSERRHPDRREAGYLLPAKPDGYDRAQRRAGGDAERTAWPARREAPPETARPPAPARRRPADRAASATGAAARGSTSPVPDASRTRATLSANGPTNGSSKRGRDEHARRMRRPSARHDATHALMSMTPTPGPPRVVVSVRRDEKSDSHSGDANGVLDRRVERHAAVRRARSGAWRRPAPG